MEKTLKSFNFFKNLSDTELGFIQKLLVKKYYKKGELLIEQGQSDEEVFLITKGRVKVFILNENGKEVNLALIGEGETIGELSVLIKGPRSATCEAIEDVETLILSGENFRRIIEQNPNIALGFLKYFGERILKANTHIEEIVTMNLVERTHLLLKSLVQNQPNNTTDFTHESLANILSATRPRVTEALQKLEKEHKIQVFPHKIKVF